MLMPGACRGSIEFRSRLPLCLQIGVFQGYREANWRELGYIWRNSDIGPVLNPEISGKQPKMRHMTIRSALPRPPKLVESFPVIDRDAFQRIFRMMSGPKQSPCPDSSAFYLSTMRIRIPRRSDKEDAELTSQSLMS